MNLGLLTKLAELLNKRGHTEAAYQIDAFIKNAYTLDFYHGTSTIFLHSILKTGLSPAPKSKVWSEDYGRDKGTPGLESFPGAYVSNNFMTAYSAAYSATTRFGGNRLIVIGQVETRSPETRIDEDHVREPGAGISIEDKIVADWYRNSNLLDYFAFDASNEQLQSTSKTWVEKALGIKPTDEVLKRAAIAMRAWLDMRVALEYEREQDFVDPFPTKDYSSTFTIDDEDKPAPKPVRRGGSSIWNGISSKLKKRFGENIPAKYSDTMAAIRTYRTAFDDFLAKAKDLLAKTDISGTQRDRFMVNVRLTKPISYKGANKIQAIVEIDDEAHYKHKLQWRPDLPKVPAKLIVHYVEDRSAVDKMIEEYRKSVGSDFEVVQK